MSPPKVRFPPITPSDETPTQRELHAEIEKVLLGLFGPKFNINDESGAMDGPFSLLIRTPSLLLPYINYGHAIATLNPTHFTPLERELSTLATLSQTGAKYGLDAHTTIGASLGLSSSQLEDAKTGRVPDGLTDHEARVYQFALELAKGIGKVEDRVFEEAKEKLGEEAVMATVQIVAWYQYNSVLLNAGNVGEREGK